MWQNGGNDIENGCDTGDDYDIVILLLVWSYTICQKKTPTGLL
jgi:hypothetical protein